MAAGKKLTQAEAAARFEAKGFVLLGVYVNQYERVEALCAEHGEKHMVSAANIFRGHGLKCCHREGVRKSRTGSVMSGETKAKLSAIFSGAGNANFGFPLSDEHKQKVSAGLRAAAKASVDYAINKAATGKTAGKSGYFYMAKTGDGLVKFGSIVRLSPTQRMQFLRAKTGAAELLLLTKVDDAGGYEAAMLNAHRTHWAHGEHLHPSVLAL